MGFPGNQSLYTRRQGAAQGRVSSSTHSYFSNHQPRNGTGGSQGSRVVSAQSNERIRLGSRYSQASGVVSTQSKEKPRTGTRYSQASGVVSTQSKEKPRTGTRYSQASGILDQSKEKPNFFLPFPQEKRRAETYKASSSDSRPSMFLRYPSSHVQKNSSIDSNKGKKQARPRTPSRTMSVSGVESWYSMSSSLVSAIDDRSLRQAFRLYGEIDKSNVVYNRETGRSQGSVRFDHTQSMKDGIKGMSDRNLDGRRSITLDEAQSRGSGCRSGGGSSDRYRSGGRGKQSYS